MARVLLPVHARSYNPNPRGSSTTTVMMRADNPFESRSTVLNQRSGSMPGMGGLGEPGALMDPPAAAPGIDWTKLLTGVSQVGVQVGGQIAANAVAQHYGTLPAAGAQNVPTLTNPGFRPVAAPSSWIPWALIGGAVVLGGGILLMARGKKKGR